MKALGWILLFSVRTGSTLKQTMWNYVGLIKTDARLKRAEGILRELARGIDVFYRKALLSDELIGLRHASLAAFSSSKLASGTHARLGVISGRTSRFRALYMDLEVIRKYESLPEEEAALRIRALKKQYGQGSLPACASVPAKKNCRACGLHRRLVRAFAIGSPFRWGQVHRFRRGAFHGGKCGDSQPVRSRSSFILIPKRAVRWRIWLPTRKCSAPGRCSCATGLKRPHLPFRSLT